MLFSEIAKVKLIQEPTSLETMERLQKHLGCASVYVKRDDCMTLGMGGNKVRSLEYWMGEAKRINADVIVVAGAPVSNQCRLAAAAAAKLGIKCLILHSSEPGAKIEGNLFLNYLLGAEVRFIGAVDEDRRKEIALEEVAKLKTSGHTPYLIGDPIVGAMGYISCALELHEQAKAKGAGIRHVFLPGSMGTTEAGFILGNAMLGHPFEIHLISVEYSKLELGERIEQIHTDTSKHWNFNFDSLPWDKNVHIYDQYLGEGYDIPTEKSLEAISLAASLEGFFLENTYTSKTFAGMVDLLQNDKIIKNEISCFIHTGGLPTLFALNDEINKKLLSKRYS